MTLEYVRGGFQPHTEDRMAPWLPHMGVLWGCGIGCAWGECTPREGAGGCSEVYRGERHGDLHSEHPEIPSDLT